MLGPRACRLWVLDRHSVTRWRMHGARSFESLMVRDRASSQSSRSEAMPEGWPAPVPSGGMVGIVSHLVGNVEDRVPDERETQNQEKLNVGLSGVKFDY